MVMPLMVVLGALGWGWRGAASAALAVGLVAANFALAAALLSWAARISPNVLMATALFGFLGRFGLLAAAVFALKGQGWVELLPLGLGLFVTHLGLLVWETRYVSLSLAYPGLKPTREGA
jgi:hypothetical protein